MTFRRSGLAANCTRCGGFLAKGFDSLSCMLCGHQQYEDGFLPLGLDPADAPSETVAPITEDSSEWDDLALDMSRTIGGRLPIRN
jgi:hypothetical protein